MTLIKPLRIFLSCSVLLVSAVALADEHNESGGDLSTESSRDLPQALSPAERLWQAKQEQGRWPLLASELDLSVDKAYQVQSEYQTLSHANAQISGFKAGLTTLGSWHHFGLTEPLSGVLFIEQQLKDAVYVIKPGLKFEAEFAFRLKSNLNHPVQSIEELKPYIDAIAPAVELPSLAFSDKPKGVDVISVNAAAHKYYIGSWQPLENADVLKGLTVSLSCEGRIVQMALGESVYGDPLAAALWLVRKQLSLGYKLRAGQILLTGAIGKMITPKPCDYELDFEQLGRIKLKLS